MRLALGTVQFGLPYGVANTDGQVPQAGVDGILEYSRLVGINTLDTAIDYGESERNLGLSGVRGFNIITKLPAIPAYCKDVEGWVCDEVHKSTTRLGVKSLYGLMLHRPEQLLGRHGAEILEALSKLKRMGVVEKVGISVYSPDEIDPFFALGKFDMVQCPFNLVDRRLVESGLLAQLKAAGVEVHTRSCFLQGLLLMPRNKIPRKFTKWNRLWDEWHDWLRTSNVSAIEACLAYVLSCSEIDRVVVGVNSQAHLEEIVRATEYNGSNIYPKISCEDEALIHPANWSFL